MNDNREQLTQQIIDAGRFLYGRGWSPATSRGRRGTGRRR